MSLFRWCLKDATDGACFVSSGKLFHERNELKWSVRMSFVFLRLYSSQWFPESMRGRDL